MHGGLFAIELSISMLTDIGHILLTIAFLSNMRWTLDKRA
ncbi:hypothetical protein AVDCRST_MAG84-7066 [uncultured Microcoleus sp.]|uniref:Uncharacterized protein n=1 Tax=uncultured Microcoleus sp. TaxID=259945 RepID=A0A6J4PLC6_9CYAN|nr:hypothetical protein AVDCRST_MAG84-7066 [uncultured Microcoleus sp.]